MGRYAAHLLLLILLLGLLMLSILPLWQAYESWSTGRIYFGVQVWGVPVGGMRPDDAARLVQQRMGGLGESTVVLVSPERPWEIRRSDLGVRLAALETALAAYAIGRGPADSPESHLELLVDGRNLAPILSFDQAAARLYLQTLARQIDRAPTDATVNLQGTTPVAAAGRAGRAVDVEATLAALRALLADPQGSEMALVVHEIPPQVVDAEPLRARLETILAAPLTLVLSHPREGDPGPWVLPPEEVAAMMVIRAAGSELQVSLDPAPLQAYLEPLAPALAVAPVDARFHFDDASGQLTPLTASVDGRALDVAASVQAIQAAVQAGQHVATLAVQTVAPAYPDTATAEGLGIREQVAEGDSYFIGSPSGRDHNIRLAASQFDGVIVGPGETFSFNELVGEITAEAGYDESYVTAGEQLAIEVGGGICQVSTTVYRAALWGGYPIDERWYHYQRVGYYELRGYGPGFDATVYSPLLDLRFTNDRAAPLLIESEVVDAEHRLIFRFYSSDDGRRVDISEPVVSEPTEPGPPIYQLDESLTAGTVIEWQTAQGGLTATFERWVYDANDNLLWHNTYVSRYAPRRAAYRYGPGYTPPVE